MSDEQIQKALECCLLGECMSCPIIRFQDCRIMLKDETISLFNRQQERIEELEIITGLANNRKCYRKFVDEVFCKQKGNELSEPDFDYIYQLYFEQQAEIEKWKVEYTRACAERDARICTQDYFKSEAIKEFAERLKAKVDLDWDNSVDVEDIDRLVAKMVGGENA